MTSLAGSYSLTERLLFPAAGLDAAALARQLSGKTVLITGATFGIGEALAQILSQSAAHLVLVARTTARLEELKTTLSTHGCKVTIHPTDLHQPAQVAALITALQAQPSGIDVVVSNAGKSIMRPVMESLDRPHDFTRTMGINYHGPVQLLLGILPILKDRKGHIINVSAINVLLPPAPLWAAYQASKSAFDQWLRCAAPELKEHGIAVTSVYLPLVRTRMIEPNNAYARAPAMSPLHAAHIIARSIVSRPRHWSPWWLGPARRTAGLFTPVWQKLALYYHRKHQ